MLAENNVMPKPKYANSFTLRGILGINNASNPRILAIVSSILKYLGNPKWTNAPSGPFGKGKWSLKMKFMMLNIMITQTIPVVVL
jgi:hypothetical protein